MAIRRHHLIEEAKAELDVAYEEVKRAEHAVMELEFIYNERLRDLPPMSPQQPVLIAEKERRQEEHYLSELYDLQNEAAKHFSVVSAAFAIVNLISDEDMSLDLIKRILFQPEFLRRNKMEVDKHIRKFHRGLRDYMHKESNSESDSAIRVAWIEIERMIRLQTEESKTPA